MIGFFMMDWHYLLYVALPMMALMLLCQLWVKAAYAKYKEIQNRQGITGREAAYVILRKAGIEDVRIEESDGFLSDHYAPTEKVLRLSHENYAGTSIAAVGIAAHEAGHAIQHAKHYAPLIVRNFAVPMASIGSQFGYLAIILGLFMSGGNPQNPITLLGLAGLAAVALFQLVNLPVEFDASRRALQLLPGIGILDEEENQGARSVLTAAAFTYVAATIAAVWTLLYWAMRLGLLGGNRDRD
ncbi:MAG: zinc metallopeptidase [Planctomycetota bacterium]|nr:zinc metallopeptidase [Planctomycetota bacterium]